MQYTIEDLGLINRNTFNLIYLPYLFFTPPFLYFFVVHYLEPHRTNKKAELLIYLPAAVFLCVTVTYKFITLVTQSTYGESPYLDELVDFIDRYADFVNIVLFFIVVILLFRKLNDFTKKKVDLC